MLFAGFVRDGVQMCAECLLLCEEHSGWNIVGRGFQVGFGTKGKETGKEEQLDSSSGSTSERFLHLINTMLEP